MTAHLYNALPGDWLIALNDDNKDLIKEWFDKHYENANYEKGWLYGVENGQAVQYGLFLHQNNPTVFQKFYLASTEEFQRSVLKSNPAPKSDEPRTQYIANFDKPGALEINEDRDFHHFVKKQRPLGKGKKETIPHNILNPEDLAKLKETLLPKTKVVAAFPGTGKSYITQNQISTGISAIEVEYHLYRGNENPEYAFANDVRNLIQSNKYDYIFIPTDPDAIQILWYAGLQDITVVYPDISLRNDYLDRYIKRDSPYDFIGSYMKYWDLFVTQTQEIKLHGITHHVLLTKDEYLQDILQLK